MATPSRNDRRTVVLLLLVLATANAVQAQTASSFDDLRHVLKTGQTIVVIDTSGHTIKGQVSDVSGSPPSLTIALPRPRTFPESSIAEVRTTDRVWNGALIGAGIGTGLAVWDYLIDPSEPGNGMIFAVSIGLGTAIGAGIDALHGGRVVYRSASSAARRLTIAPIVTRTRHGLQVAVRF